MQLHSIFSLSIPAAVRTLVVVADESRSQDSELDLAALMTEVMDGGMGRMLGREENNCVEILVAAEIAKLEGVEDASISDVAADVVVDATAASKATAAPPLSLEKCARRWGWW